MTTLQHKTIRKLVNKNNPVILEIGANVGRDSQRFLDIFPNVQLFCIEPDPRCVFRFKQNIQDKRCTLCEMAISDNTGYMNLYLSTGHKPGHNTMHINSSSLSRPTGHLEKFPWCTFNESLEVKTMTLDDWAKQYDVKYIDFIWADTQGHERQLITGGKKTLSISKFLYTEYNNDELYEGQINLNEIVRLLIDFKIRMCFDTNVLLERI